MTDSPYMVYPARAQTHAEPGVQVMPMLFINEPGQVCYGTVDFLPRQALALHTHNTWELIIVGGESPGPGFVFFDDQWWRADPGAALFVPKGGIHAWSAGSHNGFKMLWVYQGSVQEAGRNWVKDHRPSPIISPEEEKNAPLWTPEAGERAAARARRRP